MHKYVVVRGLSASATYHDLVEELVGEGVERAHFDHVHAAKFNKQGIRRPNNFVRSDGCPQRQLSTHEQQLTSYFVLVFTCVAAAAKAMHHLQLYYYYIILSIYL